MDLTTLSDGSARFAKYVDELTGVIGHADRVQPLRDYCAGLLVSEGRKSVEPLAAVTAPAEVSAQHQRLIHFVANAPWSDEQVLAKVRESVLPAIERHGPIEAWIIDDTSFPKQGTHSVGVHHQYCGQLGKQANCQVAVTLSIANHHASLPIAYRLYLPQNWAEDAARRKKARVPKAVRFETKPQIALKQIRAAFKAGVPAGVVLMDASYGYNLALRTEITALGLTYVAAITSTVKVCKAKDHDPRRESVKELALRLPKHAWRTITWREGTNEPLRSRFARLRVHASPTRGRRGRPEETLLIEWPRDAKEPTKYWFATVDEMMELRRLVDLAISRQDALAHRARLPGPQAGNRARPLRGPWLARIPSPRHAVHRSLWIPDHRKGSDSPLRTSLQMDARKTCHSQRLPTPRRLRSDRNVTFPIQLPRSIAC
jgi:SRSO17 transposase